MSRTNEPGLKYSDVAWPYSDPTLPPTIVDTYHLTSLQFPLLPNPKVDGVDPDKTDFMSTWNFIYKPDDIEKVVSLARANFEEGREQTQRTVRAVYERKKKLRLQREEKEKIKAWKRKLTVLYD